MSKANPNTFTNKDVVYDICHLEKQKKLSYLISNNRALEICELLHFDVWGLYQINFVHGHKYFLTVVHDYSIFLWVILIKSKF